MERSAWPDQRLDAEFGGLREDVRDLRAELRTDMRELEAGLRREIADQRSLMIKLHALSLTTTLGIIAAIVARGI